MRIVFMGTPEFASVVLEFLVQEHKVVGVVTQPDASRSRGNKKDPSPVKLVAQELGIKVFEAENFKDAGLVSELSALKPQVIVVAAYGALLPEEVLNLAPHGAINVHASLLPRWRGAAPIERAILAEDERTGVSIMKMEKGLDTGDYAIQAQVPVEDKSLLDLTKQLAFLGSKALTKTLSQIEDGSVEWTPQDESLATYAEKVSKKEMRLSPELTAKDNVLRVRASSDSAPARTQIAGRGVRVLEAAILTVDDSEYEEGAKLEPGQGHVTDAGLVLGASDAPLLVSVVRPDGKRTMDAVDFGRGVSREFEWKAL